MGGGGAVVRVAKAAALGGYRAAHSPWARGWESDEWELAGGEEEALFDALHVAPPTLEEAKEAASDLKDALRGLYPPQASTGFGRSAVESRSASSESFCLEDSNAKKGCAAVLASAPRNVILQAFSLPPSAPRHVVQAFSLLQESPEVKNIVASLAADRKVWKAIMNNDKVIEFCRTHRINDQPVEESDCAEEPINESGKTMGCSVDKEGSPQGSKNGLRDFMQIIKLKVKEMVNSLSDLFENFMAETTEAGSTTIVRTSTTGRSYEDMAMGASLVALTIATIILIILKRD